VCFDQSNNLSSMFRRYKRRSWRNADAGSRPEQRQALKQSVVRTTSFTLSIGVHIELILFKSFSQMFGLEK